MRALDFAPLLRSSIGFENINRLIDFATRGDNGGETYPPYNIEKTGDDQYRVQIAAAGFSADELDITVQENTLIITGKARDVKDEANYLHRGIAKRAFERRFQLADTIRVTTADYADGLLSVSLVREVPEHKKPRKVEIGAATVKPSVIDSVRIAAE